MSQGTDRQLSQSRGVNPQQAETAAWFDRALNASTPDVETTADLTDDAGPIPTFPPRALDARGRLIPLSAEERRMRSEAAVRVLALIQARPDDDPPEADRDVMRGIDSRRAPGHKLFEGMY